MATQDYFANNASEVGEKTNPGSNAGDQIVMAATLEIAAADDNGSTYLLFQNVPASFRPTELTVMCDAITGGTDFDIGLFNSTDGVEADDDILMDGQTLASASRSLDGLQTVNIADIGKTLAELLGLTPSTAKAGYDIVLTGNTVGTAAGTVTAILKGFAA